MTENQRRPVSRGLADVDTRMDQLRARIASRDLAPPLLFRIESDDEGAAEYASRLLEEGWSWAGHPVFDLRPPIDWPQADMASRGWAFRLHSWEPLECLLSVYHRTREDRLADAAIALVLDWLTVTHRHEQTAFAWYDMAVGLRAARLSYLMDVAARRSVSDDDLTILYDGLLAHARELEDADRIAWHSNHGLYQVAGQIAIGARFPWIPACTRALDLGTARLSIMLEQQFTSEGVHREHSPEYHRMVLETLRSVAAAVPDLSGLDERLRLIEEALAWFVQPDGHLAQFGDTPRRRLSDSYAQPLSATMRCVLTDGDEGVEPAEATRAFPESGYFVTRSGWRSGVPGDGGMYLALMAAFHSRTHKHADDLSLVWYDHGHEILVDAGTYPYEGEAPPPGSRLWDLGFWYDDPKRVYVESTRAHNTVEIDRTSHRRRRVKPYGSALGRRVVSDGIIAVEAHVRHGNVRHARVLVLSPGRWLVVMDWLWDNQKAVHRFDQRFTLAPELQGVPLDGGFGFVVPDVDEQVFLTPLIGGTRPQPLVRGQTEPDLLGWVSRQAQELVPAWSCGFTRHGWHANFATLLTFDKAEPEAEDGRSAPSGRRFDLRWRQRDVRHRLVLERPATGDMTVVHRSE